MTGQPTEPPGDHAILPERVRLVVIFGGRSAEHDVSRVSAANVLAAVDPNRYHVVPIAITRDGAWLSADDALAELSATGSPPALGLTVSGQATDPLPAIQPPPGHGGAPEVPTVVLPVLHGPNGEDGTIQGLLELAGVPYIGSGVLGSALAMDKAKAKEVLAGAGIGQAPWCTAAQWELDAARLGAIVDELGFPMFVKPANMGSSVGVSKVTGLDGLEQAIDEALRHDERLVFEAGVVGREIEIGVLGSTDVRLSVPGEVIPAADFYSYDDKYHDDAASLVIPAELTAEQTAQVRSVALAAYQALRCEILARVDMFVTEEGVLVNEVNTFPGFTPISMFPRLWAASGLEYSALIDELVRLALARHRRRGSRGADRTLR